MSRKTMLIFALLTIMVMGGGGTALIYFFSEISLQLAFQGRYAIYFQFLVGIIYGLLAAVMAWRVVQWPGMIKTRTFFQDLFQSSGIKTIDIIVISICAGVGEEILFRGFVQPYLGIWITSILFVLLHGYLNPMNRPLFVYGVVMVVLIGGIGLIAERVGIISAMIAHTIIDIYLLKKLVSG